MPSTAPSGVIVVIVMQRYYMGSLPKPVRRCTGIEIAYGGLHHVTEAERTTTSCLNR